MSKVSLIAAMAENRTIGNDGRMPWHLPEDLKRFRKLTYGKPVVMGRKTFESIGRPLDGRRNIVLSRAADLQLPGIEVVASPDAALKLIADRPTEETMVIGGGEIYRLFLPLADKLYITLIRRCFDGDARFPEFDPADFALVEKESCRNDDFAFDFTVYARLKT